MTPSPEITVVIPVHNRAKLVGETLECLRSQDLRPLSVILVDNNSTDNTLEVLERWKQENKGNGLSVKILQEKIPGAAAARNCGLAEVETPLTMFFDSDDLMSPGHCRRVVEGFKAHPHADIVGWDCDGVLPGRTRKTLQFADRNYLYNLLHFGSFSTQRYAARTELFRRAGGWNESCMGWNDIELGTRLLDLNPNIVKLEGEPTVLVRFTPESITGMAFSHHPERWEHSAELIGETIRQSSSPLLSPKRKALRMLRLRMAILAGDYVREGDHKEGRRLLDALLREESSWRFRLLYRFAARFRASGRRGFGLLLRPFF